MIRSVMLAVLFLCGSVVYSAEERITNLWRPAWGEDYVDGMLRRTAVPGVFEIMRAHAVTSEVEAAAFMASQPRPSDVKRTPRFYVCRYYEIMDARAAMTPQNGVDWQDPRAQYFFYYVLFQNVDVHMRMFEGKIHVSRSYEYLSEDEYRRNLPPPSELVYSDLRTNSLDQVVYYVRTHHPVDIAAEAAHKYLAYVEGCRYLIPENIGTFRCLGAGAGGALRDEVGPRPGRQGSANYYNDDRKACPSPGETVRVFIADTPGSLDHDFLRVFVMEGGVHVKTLANGHTVVAMGGFKTVGWKTADNTYYQCGEDSLPVLEAYLKRFPSVLPRDFKVDDMAWKRQEVELCLARMRETVGPEGGHALYWQTYKHLLAFIDPIPGAPLMTLAKLAEFDATDRAYHLSLVEAWRSRVAGNVPVRRGPARSLYELVPLAVLPKDFEAVKADFKSRAKAWKASHSPAPVPAGG